MEGGSMPALPITSLKNHQYATEIIRAYAYVMAHPAQKENQPE
jgi:hypothetical protein